VGKGPGAGKDSVETRMALAKKAFPVPRWGGSWDREMGEVRGWRCRREAFFNVKLWIFRMIYFT